jgi:hypothetical protein
MAETRGIRSIIMSATAIALLLLVATLVVAGLGWYCRSKKLGVVAVILFALLSVYGVCLILVISGM